MRAGGVLAVLVATLAIPGGAWADTVGTATTTTGQTLTIAIETPYDGVTAYGTTSASMQGHVNVTGSGTGSTSVSEVKIGIGDAYEAPGSVDYGNASYYASTNQWSTYNKIAYEGTRTLYATAIADDGTRATANLTLTLDPKEIRRILAYGALYDFSRGGPTGSLQASMSFNRTPYETLGRPIDFFVKGEKVCTASIAYTNDLVDPWFLARCQDPAALAKAVAAGGYEARYAGDQYTYPASSTAGLVVQS